MIVWSQVMIFCLLTTTFVQRYTYTWWFDGEGDEDDGEDGEDDDGEDGEDDGEDELDDVNRFDARLPAVISCCVLIW